ncbi:hypothetical protein BKA62DRAFT_724393 [Auriculariales sp. MPI-PUGE-AT-0066]|nr:hypothetical protein BKA62DRAFT_724393 [Auriculariales sp. MPI-PUGE-AT-0066]
MAAAASASSQTALDNATKASTSSWQADLKVLFDNAKERFADVVWEFQPDPRRPPEEVWGHKAMVYARAPPAFQMRYFAFRPAPVASPLPFSASPQPFAPISSVSLGIDLPGPSRSPSPYGTPGKASPAPTTGPGPLMRLHPQIDITLFTNELEYLYTGIGFGEAFEFLFDTADDAVRRDAVGDAEHLRVDKLRHDLNYMWRARLYSDVRISLTGTFSSTPSDAEASTAMFSAHRFILASRSSYFHSVLMGGFAALPTTGGPLGPVTVSLPSSPFTPAALHFTLGYLYTGSLVFSHRTYDLDTAFAIMRSANFLTLSSLHNEVEARIVEEMMHGLCLPYLPFAQYEQLTGGKWAAAGCKCRQCARRAPRVLAFSLEPEVCNRVLEGGARRQLSTLFGEGWCTPEFGALPAKLRAALLGGLAKRTTVQNIFALLDATVAGFKRLEKEQADILKKQRQSVAGKKIDPKDLDDSWLSTVREVILAARKEMDECLCTHTAEAFEQDDWLVLLEADGVGFNDKDRVEGVMASLLRGLNEKNAGQVYQTLAESVLLRPSPDDANATLLSPASPVRTIVEQTQAEIIRWHTKNWQRVQVAGGYDALAPWALKEIADAAEVQSDELLSPGPISSRGPTTRTGLRPIIPRSGIDQDADTVSMASASLRHELGRNFASGVADDRASMVSTISLRSTVTTSTAGPSSVRAVTPSGKQTRPPLVPKHSAAVKRTPVPANNGTGLRSMAASVDGVSIKSGVSASAGAKAGPSNGRKLSTPSPAPATAPATAPSSRPSTTMSMRTDVSSTTGTTSNSVYRTATASRSRTTSMASTSTVATRANQGLAMSQPGALLSPDSAGASRPRRLSTASVSSVASARSTASTSSKAPATSPGTKKVASRGPPTPTPAPPRQRAVSTASTKSVKSTTSGGAAAKKAKEAPPVPKVPPPITEKAAPKGASTAKGKTVKTPPEATKPKPEDKMEVDLPEPPASASTVRVRRRDSSDTITMDNAVTTGLAGAKPRPDSQLSENVRTIKAGSRPAGLTFDDDDETVTQMVRRPIFPQAPLPTNKGVTLNVGIPCIITSRRQRMKAFARYIGEVAGESGPWIGVEVPIGATWGGERLEGRDWHDGTWGGVRYFDVGAEDWIEMQRSQQLARARGVKREGDTLRLFVRPQQVLYVVQSEGSWTNDLS